LHRSSHKLDTTPKSSLSKKASNQFHFKVIIIITMKFVSSLILLLSFAPATAAAMDEESSSTSTFDDQAHAALLRSRHLGSSSSSSEGGPSPRRLCKWLMDFDTAGRGYGNDPAIPGFEWENYCHVVSDKQTVKLCPKNKVLNEICGHKNWHLNPAVNQGKTSCFTTTCCMYVLCL
jgi:hypothetical protein